MADRLTLSLREPQQAHKAIGDAWCTVKALLLAGHRLVLGGVTFRVCGVTA